MLDTIAGNDLLDHAAALGKDIAAGIEALEHPLVDHVRGRGLLLGIVLRGTGVAHRRDGGARGGVPRQPRRSPTWSGSRRRSS